MFTQEEYMDLLALRRAGLTIAEIADQLDYHPQTISKWLRSGGPPAQRELDAEHRVITPGWAMRIEDLLAINPRLLSTSLFDILALEGFAGSYPTVVRFVRQLRGPRFRAAAAASVPIETAPSEECQFDWSDCTDWARRWGWPGELWCFGAILCWSRWRRWWFTTSIDRNHTFEGLVGFFEAAGGVPQLARTDRMGALGQSQGKRFRLHPPTVGFARHHGVEIKACAAGDSARKGKVERPFRDMKESLLEELDALGPPASLGELNRRGEAWLARRMNGRPHRVTDAVPDERLRAERTLLAPLPRVRFDTAYVEVRRVHRALPLIEWDGVRYSVPPEVLGQRVEVRLPVDGDSLEVRWAGEVVARHHLGFGGDEVWDPAHRAATETIALGRHRPRAHLRLVGPDEADDQRAHRLDLDGDVDVDAPDLARYAIGAVDRPQVDIDHDGLRASRGHTEAGSRPEEAE
jgi:transposase